MIIDKNTKHIPGAQPDTVAAVWNELRAGEAAEDSDLALLHGLDSDDTATVHRVFAATAGGGTFFTPEICSVRIPRRAPLYLLRRSHGATLHRTFDDAFDATSSRPLDEGWTGQAPAGYVLAQAMGVYANISRDLRSARARLARGDGTAEEVGTLEAQYAAAAQAVRAVASLVLTTASEGGCAWMTATDALAGIGVES